MEKPKRQLAKFEELWLEQMQPLNAERLLNQINFVEADLDRLCSYAYSKENEDNCLIFRLKSFVRRTLRNMARFTVARGKTEVSNVINKSCIRMYKAGQVVSIFDAVGCEDPNTNLPRRTYCVFQKCDNHGLNRLVDKISSDIQVGIDYYSRMGEVLFIPDHNEKEDMPENILFFDKEKLAVSDIEWLRNNQDYYGTPIADWIQREADNGNLGITRGVYVRVIEDYVSAHPFIVELRHIY